jgi:hypothetical protein
MSDNKTMHAEATTKKRARLIFWQWFTGGILLLWLVASTTLSLIAALEAHNARDQIVSCVIPDGECYEQNQKRTGHVVEELLEDGIQRETVTRATIIASVWCDEQPDVEGLAELEACVKNQLTLRERDRGDG